jgi:hypothetical protein
LITANWRLLKKPKLPYCISLFRFHKNMENKKAVKLSKSLLRLPFAKQYIKVANDTSVDSR